MTNLVINTLWNANVFLNGINLLGRAGEIEIPHPKRLMMDFKSLGMAGRVEIPTGWDKLEATTKWTSFDQDAITALLGAPMTSLSAMCNLQVLSAAGVISELPVIYNMTGIVKDAGKLAVKGQENADFTSVMAIWHSELYVAGVQIYLYDAGSNQYIVGGVDQLASFRANIGG